MVEKSSSYFFIKQNKKEKLSKLTQLNSRCGDVLIWQKGDKYREKFTCVNFDNKNFIISLEIRQNSHYANKEILYSFSLNGVSYFGQSNLKMLRENIYIINCSGDLYKSERRNSFRLLTYPHYSVFVYVQVSPESLSESNIVDMKTKMTETALFKNFLKMVDGDEADSLEKGYLKFRVLDISVSGLAFQMSELEKSYVSINDVISPLVLIFKDEKIEIPKAEIKYIIPLVSNSKEQVFKVGVKFEEINTNIDELLGKRINDALRDIQTEFENFF